jgi:hypothetical protein
VESRAIVDQRLCFLIVVALSALHFVQAVGGHQEPGQSPLSISDREGVSPFRTIEMDAASRARPESQGSGLMLWMFGSKNLRPFEPF